jgi:hypothetical protein
MVDEVKNVVVTQIKIVIISGDAKAMVRHLWKAVELHEQHYITTKFNRKQPIKIVHWNCRKLRSKFPDFQQRSQNVDVIILQRPGLTTQIVYA